MRVSPGLPATGRAQRLTSDANPHESDSFHKCASRQGNGRSLQLTKASSQSNQHCHDDTLPHPGSDGHAYVYSHCYAS